MLFIEVRICHHGCEHLSKALTVTNVGGLLLLGLLQYEIPKSWLIKDTFFVETEVPILLVEGFLVFQFTVLGLEVYGLVLKGVFAAS